MQSCGVQVLQRLMSVSSERTFEVGEKENITRGEVGGVRGWGTMSMDEILIMARDKAATCGGALSW